MARRRSSSNPTHGGNGMTGEYQYREQQDWIDEVASSLGLVAFRPDYHGKVRDGNTVLVYTREDDAHNRKVDYEPFHYSSRDEAKLYGCTDERYYYRPYIWSFENTDANGKLDFGFANFGRLDLGYLDTWRDVILGSMKLAYYKNKQIQYVKAMGGYGGIREADDIYNDLNISIIKAFQKAYGKALLGNPNPFKDGDPIFWEYNGKNTFWSSFVVSREDEKLRDMIRAWRGDTSLPKAWADVNRITKRVEEIGGELLVWC